MFKRYKNDPYNIVVDTEKNKVSASIGFNYYENLNIMIENNTKKEYIIIPNMGGKFKLYLPGSEYENKF